MRADQHSQVVKGLPFQYKSEYKNIYLPKEQGDNLLERKKMHDELAQKSSMKELYLNKNFINERPQNFADL